MTTTELLREGDTSHQLRVLVRLVALGIVVIGTILGVKNQSITQPVIGFFVAYCFSLLSLIAHLNLGGALSASERRAWTSRLWSSSGVILVLIMYLSHRDLREATRELAGSNGEAQ